MSMNKVFLTGRIANDLEVKTTTTGISVCSFTLAVDQDFKNKETGERKTDYIRCNAFRQTADFIGKMFSKGRLITIIGRIQVRQYEKDGDKRTVTEVIVENVYFADSKPNTSHDSYQKSNSAPAQSNGNSNEQFVEEDDDYEDDGKFPF